jgi:deoxyadenosine/deoxycytidine kinase
MSDFQLKKPILISIEGNIGAGKTTIIEQMQKRIVNNKIIFLREPVDLWESIKDSQGEGILVKFYKDPAKYAFPFQVMAYATRLSMVRNIVKNNPECEIIICERSLDADKNIFAKMLYNDGLIDEVCFQIYNRFYTEYSDDFNLKGIIYIDADPDVCCERIKKRARNGEGNINLDYLEKCKDFHKKWIEEGNDLGETKVLHIKTNEEATYNENDINDNGNKWILMIEEFLQKLI